MPNFLRGVPYRRQEFALLTILFIPAGALILDTVNNSLTEHKKKCLSVVEKKVKTVMVLDSEKLTA